jgi:hypothetical protein
MITSAGATSQKITAKSFDFEYLAQVIRIFIGPLVCCLRSLNGSSQREALLDLWCSHRVGTVESFLDVQM